MTEAGRLVCRAIRFSGWYAGLLVLTSLAGTTAELLLPAALGRAVDAVLDRAAAPRWLALVGILVAVAAAADTLGELADGLGTARATARLRGTLLRHILLLRPATAARYPVGDLVARLVGQATDAGAAATAAGYAAIVLLPPLGSLVALFLLDPWLGITFVLGLALLSLLLRRFVADASAATAGYLRVQGTIAGRFVEALSGARTVAAAGTADREVDRILEPLPELHAHGRRTWTALASAAARTALLAPLLQLAILAVAGLLLSAGRLSPGGLFAAVQYAALGAGLGAVVATLNRLIRTRTGARRLAEVIGEPATEFGTRELPPGPGTLRFNSVTVNAGPESAGPLTAGPLLDRIDLTVPAGQTVAVVGRSGAGKSVLATVAGRLRDPDGGEVTLDGVPLADLAPDALASAVGYGFERPVLVGNTIADALALGHAGTDPDIPDPDVRQAARIAAIDGYVRRLPDGYRTRLAEAPMSGGEAQRLGLARALHGRRLLVLDDASSSVDSVTEAELGRAMREQLAGRTRLVVTHRVATAARADLVAWLAAGRLRGFAPHHVLWTDPAYRAVFATGDPDEPN